jgi:hypothetical protein
MQLSCEVCHAPLRPEDVRVDVAAAQCHTCNAVYDLSGRKARGLSASAQERPRLTRAKVPLPARFQVEDDEGATRITWRWLDGTRIFMLCLGAVWNGALVLMYSTLLKGNLPLITVLLPLPFVLLGLMLAYQGLAGVLNHTKIEVSREQLTLQHGPLPSSGNLKVPGHHFTQLFGVEQVLSHKGGKTTCTYDLFALDREGGKVKLITGLMEKDQVLYLEQALERRLGIEDTPVDGELATRTSGA